MTFFVFLFGLVIGSFLNVVILRYNTGFGIGGRSRCFSCSKTLSWHELVPVLSYFLLRGKCRGCKAAISPQYFLVELFTGLLFVFFFWKIIHQFGFLPLSFLLIAMVWILWSLLMVIFVYDLRHHIIPDALVYAFALLGLWNLFLECTLRECSSNYFLHNILAGLILFSFFFLLWFVSRGTWIGFGDAKLALGIGFYLGLAGGLSALAFAFWIGAMIGILLIVYQKIKNAMHFSRLSSSSKTLTMKSALPFAPFLILGTFLSVFWGSDIFGIHLFF